MQNLDPVRGTYDELIRAVATSGELSAWQMLYDRLNTPLNTYAQKILRTGRCPDPPDHSREVTQETWCRTVRAISQCSESPTGWLFRIARNASFDHLQDCVRFRGDQKGWPEPPGADESFLEPRPRLYSHEELFLRSLSMRQAVSRLNPDEQLVLRLRLADVDYKEIARRTGLPEVNARKLFQRAKAKLRVTLAEGD